MRNSSLKTRTAVSQHRKTIMGVGDLLGIYFLLILSCCLVFC
jgi:hypothetical protein